MSFTIWTINDWFFRLVPYALALVGIYAFSAYTGWRRRVAAERQLAVMERKEAHLAASVALLQEIRDVLREVRR